MATLQEMQKFSNRICRLLKVTDVTFPIGKTPKGNLGIVFNSNNEGFEMLLDSVPLSTKNSLEDENNIELKRMIEKYLFEEDMKVYQKGVETVPFNANGTVKMPEFPVSDVTITPIKGKGGRPHKEHVQETNQETA